MFPSTSYIADRLTHVLSGRGQVLHEGNAILLIPSGPGWVMRLTVSPEIVCVFTGLGVTILVGEDSPGDLDPLLEVVTAVMNGDVEEFFGTGDEGSLTSIGHRVWYPNGQRKAGYEGTVSATVRAPAWSGPLEACIPRSDGVRPS